MTAGVPVLLWTLAVSTAAGGDDVNETVIEVDAGAHARRGTPVVWPLPEELAQTKAFALEDLDARRPVPAQVVPGAHPGLAWIVRDPLPAGSKRRYRLRKVSEAPVDVPVVGVDDDGKALDLKIGDRLLLRYHEAVVESPEGIDAEYRRSGQIHPLLTPSGRSVTDDFPPDHAHQHGLFFAWVNTTFEGHPIDFWNQMKRTGRVSHGRTLGVSHGPVFGQFFARLRHEDVSRVGHPVRALDETWTIRAYNLDDVTLVDFESRQSCAGTEPLRLNAYHYGGFGLRGNRAWFDPGAKGEDPPDPARSGACEFLTGEGKHRADGNHTRPRWVDLSGRVEGQFAGVAVLDHPTNFRFPQPVRLHPNKPYFSFAPTVLGPFSIEPGQTYVSRYRLVVHDGPADPDAIERAWHDYAEPPRVRVVAE